jgi:hypothetical protein
MKAAVSQGDDAGVGAEFKSEPDAFACIGYKYPLSALYVFGFDIPGLVDI